MRLTKNQSGLRRNDQLLSLDWESLGRYVRGRTLEAVAMHFAALAAEQQDASEGRGNRRRSSGRKR